MATRNLPDARAPNVSRRRFIRGALFASIGLAGAGALAGLVEYLYPSDVPKQARLNVGNLRDYPAGSPPVHFQGKRAATAVFRDGWGPGGFWLANLDPDDRARNGTDGKSGVVALADYCTHLGCSIPWRPQFAFEGVEGWFRCPCHGATFTRAGREVFGPAPRGLDTYRVAVDADGTIRVDNSRVVRASANNGTPPQATPTRVSPPPRAF